MLETERLILRKITMDDLEDWYEILSDKETMKYYPKPYTKEMVINWINRNEEYYDTFGFGLYALVIKGSNKMIGDCEITMQNINGQIKPEIGYHINKKYHNKGYATEAARKCRDFIFENTTFNKVYSYMKSDNIGSYSVAIKNGMSLVEKYTDQDRMITVVYAITRSEWENI